MNFARESEVHYLSLTIRDEVLQSLKRNDGYYELQCYCFLSHCVAFELAVK